MKKIFLISLVLLTQCVYGQNFDLTNFNSKFASVANKSTSWNSLIDFLRPTNSLRYYKLTEKVVTKDPCMIIQQQGVSCPQFDYAIYFKRASGADTIRSDNQHRFIQTYTFETNSRPGNDLSTNIDTIRSARFDWKLVSIHNNLSKKQLRDKYLNLYDAIVANISQYYGLPVNEANNNNNVEKGKYWTYIVTGSAMARIVLIYDQKTKDYLIKFSGNIQRKT